MIVQLRTVQLEFDNWMIYARFPDGKVNEFWIPINHDNQWFQNVAKEYGYDDWWRYSQEHELAHHFLADNLGMKWSWAVHDETRGNHTEWEENLVNAFQNFVQTETKDKWNVLHCVFPDYKLIKKKYEFLRIVRHVLELGQDVIYDHNKGTVNVCSINGDRRLDETSPSQDLGVD